MSLDRTSERDRPFVSVIIPVYNDPEGIRQCLSALEEQTYHSSQFEVLVVDNGSTDDTRSVVSEFPVTLLVEDTIQGSYAARNLGIKNASGDIFAFTDADCTPAPTWLEAGVDQLEMADADLVGGRVVFEFSPEQTAAERFDASVNMRNDESVRDGVAKTANVFTRREVVTEIGPFPEHLISGGDVHWTQAATDSGFSLVYGSDTVVYHPARQLHELLSKQFRVGRGQIQQWQLNDQPAAWILLVGLLRFPMKVVGFLLDEGNEEEEISTPEDRDIETGLRVTFVAGCCMIAMTLGRIAGITNALIK